MIPLFQLLADQSVDWIINHSTEQRIDANEVLIREGTQIGSMYIVTEGLLGAYAGGKQIGIAGPGTVVGEMSFVDQDPTAASLVALEQTHLLELSRETVAAQVAADPVFASDFFRAIAVTLSQRLRVLSQSRTGRTFTRAEAERAFDNEDWRHALATMAEFKRMLVGADHESIKADGVSEETYQKLAKKSTELQELSYRLLGDVSPLTPYMKEQLGGLLQTELLPYVLLTGTIERCYSKPRGYAGDYFTIAVTRGKVKAYNPANVDGSGAAYGILWDFADADSADVKGTAIVRDAEVNAAELVWFSNATNAQKATGLAELLARGIVARA